MRHRVRTSHQPAVTAALVAATAVLALAAAVVEPYLAAAGDAATAAQVAREGQRSAGLSVTASGPFDPASVAAVDERLRGELGAADAATAWTVRVDPVTLTADDAEQRVRLVASSGASELVEILAGSRDGGLLLPDILAQDLDVSPGDSVAAVRGDVRGEARVAGVYRTLDPVTAPEVLQDLAVLAQPTPGREQRPLDLVLAPPADVLGLAADVQASSEVTWESPVPRELAGLGAARELRADQRRVTRAAQDTDHPLGSAIAERARTSPEGTVGLGPVVREAERAVAALTGPVRAVGVAGQAVALAVVAAAALFAARHRETELRLAAIRGRGALHQGLRSAGGAVPAIAAGAMLGYTAAMILVRAVGPGGSLASGTAVTALAEVGLALLPAVSVIAAIVAGKVAAAVRLGRRYRLERLRRVPWEVVALGASAVALAQVWTGGGLRIVDGAPQLSPLVLAFPVLLLVGTIGVGTRLAARVLPRARALGRERGHAVYLAARRLAAASGQGLALTAACALALGLVVYTAAVSGSLGTAVDEKAILQIGADAAGSGASVSAQDVDGAAVLRGTGRLAPEEETVDVLLVDPDSFTEVAYWDPGLADGRRLPTVLAPLAERGPRLPVLVAGAAEDGPVVLDVPGFRVPIEVTDRVDAFPGQAPGRTLVVADADTARELMPPEEQTETGPAGRWREQIWVTGDDAARRLEAAGATAVRSIDETAQRPRLVAVTWSLRALQALAVLATVLAVLGVLLFVASRQRQTQLSYALARRMGLGPVTHRVALGTEVLVLLGLALGTATLLGVLAAALVVAGMDPLPDLPPAPRTRWPWRSLGLLASTLALAGLGGSALLQRSADRADVAEVLRRG